MKREPRWVPVFLKHLERSGNVRLAAEGAGVDFSTSYQRRKRHGEFAERWEGALAAFASRAVEAGRALHAGPSTIPSAGNGPPPRSGEELVGRPDGTLIRASEARWSPRKEEAFLIELTVSGSVKLAAKAAGFSTTAVYRRRLKDRRFAAAWGAAVETGKARVQAYLVEAATRTFDPEELPIGDEREIPKVSIAEAINIAKLPARDGPSTSSGRGGVGGGSRGGKGFEDRTYDETGFDTTPISRHEWDEARQNIFDRLRRLREQMEDEERETGRCRSCGQALPNLTFGQDSA